MGTLQALTDRLAARVRPHTTLLGPTPCQACRQPVLVQRTALGRLRVITADQPSHRHVCECPCDPCVDAAAARMRHQARRSLPQGAAGVSAAEAEAAWHGLAQAVAEHPAARLARVLRGGPVSGAELAAAWAGIEGLSHDDLARHGIKVSPSGGSVWMTDEPVPDGYVRCEHGLMRAGWCSGCNRQHRLLGFPGRPAGWWVGNRRPPATHCYHLVPMAEPCSDCAALAADGPGIEAQVRAMLADAMAQEMGADLAADAHADAVAHAQGDGDDHARPHTIFMLPHYRVEP